MVVMTFRETAAFASQTLSVYLLLYSIPYIVCQP